MQSLSLFLFFSQNHKPFFMASAKETQPESTKSAITSSDKIRVYARIWALHRILYFRAGGWAAGIGLPVIVELVEGSALLFTLMTGTGMIASISIHFLADFCVKMPFVWTSEWLSVQTDAAFLSFTLYHLWNSSKDGVSYDEKRWNDISRAIRRITILFYFAAGFLKVNTSFLKPETSCSPIFLVQILTTYLPESMVARIPAKLVATMSPTATLFAELSVPFFWMVGGDLQAYGTVLALVFHGLIAICPPPLNFGTFSVCCVARIFTFHDDSITRAAKTVPSMVNPTTMIYASISVLLVYQAYLLGAAFPGGDKSVPVFVALCLLYGRAAFWYSNSSGKRKKANGLEESSVQIYLHKGLLVSALAWTFLLPTLGIIDMGSANMFSNLRVHGGTNHLVLPVGLLTPMLSGGGYVRVEKASPSFAPELPGELTPHMPEKTVEFLKEAGQTGRYFNPVEGKIVGRFVIPEGQSFVPYTVPMLELKRYYQLTLEERVDFQFTYSILDGFHGDETWRKESSAKRIRVTRTGGGQEEPECQVEIPNNASWRPCTEEEQLSKPHPIHAKLMAHLAYPILEDGEWDELHCFGP